MRKLPAALLILVAVSALPGRGEPPAAADLVGVWESDRVFGPEVRGTLALERTPAGWRASIGPFTAPAREDGGGIAFSLPGNRGDFRGRTVRAGAAIEGHWIQPVSATDGVRYATPVDLAKTAGGEYRGEVRPLDERLTLDLAIRRGADGALTAFVRNRQRNAGVRLSELAVSTSGDAVTLTPPRGEPITGRSHDGGKWLSFVFPFADGTFDFTRRGPEDAFGIVPRIPPEARALSRPPQTGDGWKTAAPGEAGLDPAPIEALVREIVARRAGSVRAPSIQGLLVARGGRLAVEEYFEGFSRDATHDFRSASKSLTSLLAGAAIDHGAKFGPATPVYP
ncbi:MAG TPA: 6-aminohexanoate hydrolase, partial [Thermoanaerobaculia bacterium]|nr:6-aminohexanoate hydrolase [Thermoanaerobaculia bacterium]